MASLYDSASLVMIPSGYKEDKVYSIKPTDGSGDLAFSRSNDTATRVNSSGLIEKVRTNLIVQSQDLTTSWAQNSLPTITANTTIAPDGTLTADTIAASGNSSGVYQFPSVNSGSSYAFSIYLKNISSATSITIGCDFAPTSGFLIFNAVTGTITSVGGSVTASSVTNEGNGWYRVFGTYASTGTNNTFIIYGGGVMTFAAWGTMLQESDILTPYIATTSAAVSVGPVANLPRLDYSGGASCPKLLLEPQRVNKWYFSESFDNAEWLKSNVTISANSAVSPDGYTNADKMVDTAANDEHRIRATTALFTITTATTFSIFAKAAEYSKFAIADLSLSEYVKFNLSTGVVISTGSGFSNAKIEDYGNGWYRLSATNSTASTYGYGLLNDAGDFVFTGTGTKGVFIYGAQVEEAAYATSYIPTLSAASTRGADDCVKTGISSLIGQTEGTLFIDTEVGDATSEVYGWLQASLSGNPNDSIQINKSSSSVQCQIYNGASLTGLISGGSISAGQRIKIALGYKQNDVVLYLNGTQIGTDTSTNIPTCAVFQIGTYPPLPNDYTNNGGIKQALLFKTRLTNAELAALTTI